MRTTHSPSSATLIGPLQSQVQTVLPVIGTRICADVPGPADDPLDDPATSPDDVCEATFLWHVDGGPTAEAGILEGDLVVVDRSLKPRDGDVVVAANDGAFRVKRLARGAATLEPEIWGVITWAIHKPRRSARPAASGR